VSITIVVGVYDNPHDDGHFFGGIPVGW
jgi:hypothetical protein